MEILIKPYTKKAKNEFVEKYKNEYRFEESDKALWALKYYEILEGDSIRYVLREMKYEENDRKADEKRYNQEFTITVQGKLCVFDTSAKTQADLLTAFAVCSTGETYDGWITNNGVILNLTLEDVSYISVMFKKLSDVYPKWKEYKTRIDNAVTVADLEAIEIIY